MKRKRNLTHEDVLKLTEEYRKDSLTIDEVIGFTNLIKEWYMPDDDETSHRTIRGLLDGLVVEINLCPDGVGDGYAGARDSVQVFYNINPHRPNYNIFNFSNEDGYHNEKIRDLYNKIMERYIKKLESFDSTDCKLGTKKMRTLLEEDKLRK